MKNKPEVMLTDQSNESNSLNKEILKEINFARTNPNSYLTKVQTLKKSVRPKYSSFYLNDKQVVINDIEQCFEDLIQYLSNVKPLGKLQMYEPLCKSSDEFLGIITNHPYNEENLLKNTMDYEKRLRKNGILHGVIGEVVEYGMGDAEVIVLKFLLDEKGDNIDRNILMNNSLKYVGISCAVVNSEITISVLNFSENQILKKDKLIINLNKKLVFERLGKKNDSAQNYIYKMRLHNSITQQKRKYSQSISTNSSNSLIKNIMTASPNQGNSFKFRDFLAKDSLLPNASIPLNRANIPTNPSKSTSKLNDSLNSSISNLKELKISTETLDKAPTLLKRLMSPVPQTDLNLKLNTKIVNINLVEDKTDRRREETSLNNSKISNYSSPLKTIRGGEEIKSIKNNPMNTSIYSSKQPRNTTLDVSSVFYEDLTVDKNPLKNLKYYNKEEPPKQANVPKTNRTSNNNSCLSNKDKINLNQNFGKENNPKKKTEKTVNFVTKNPNSGIKFDDQAEFEREIMDNKNVVCINVNKKKVVDNYGRESFIIKKTVYYENGSTDEWLFKG